MRFFVILAIMAGFFTAFAGFSAPAQADPPGFIIKSPLRHILFNPFFERKYNPNFDEPLLEGPKHPHNNQWEGSNWHPQQWVDFYGNPQTQLDRLEDTGIITGMGEKDDIPVLEVGHAFLRLSGQEKRRVVEYVDYVLDVTRTSPRGAMLVYDDYSNSYIGIYTDDGLQLQ